MERLKSRLGWTLAGALGIILVLALGRATLAGPLDPPGPVGSTMRTIDELLPSWGKTLTSSGGCASQRFTCVMSNAAVLDHETGVVWQRVPAAGSIDFLTADQTCREAKIGGRYGWRLPTINELLSLDDDTTADSLPAGHPFTNTPDTYLWSQTADATDAQRVQTMTFLAFGGGFSVVARARFGFNAADNARPWCVRGESDAAAQQPAEQPAWVRTLSATGGCNSARFSCVMSDQAVLDRETGLMWQRTAGPVASTTWIFANEECLLATTGGRRGWRSPTIQEGLSLVDVAGGLPTGSPFLNASGSVLYVSSSSRDGTAGLTFRTFGPSPQSVAKVSILSLASWCVRGAGGDDTE